MSEAPIRVLMTKLAFDAHDRALRYVSAKLRDAGMEVVISRFQLVEEVVNTAIQEAVDIIGVSIYTGGHMVVAQDLMDALKARGAGDIKVVFGGTIPMNDVSKLKAIGVLDVFPPGTTPEVFTASIQRLVRGEVNV